MGKRLTVIIPGYNTCEEWWRRCVESVRKACGPDDEIIVIDDGSKTPVKKTWVGADADPRVRLVRKENGGLASARNFGLELISGKYVTFVDSDDEVRAETFNRCIEALERGDSDIAVYGVQVIWVQEGLTKTDIPWNAELGRLNEHTMLDLVKLRLFNYACNKVYVTDFLNGNRQGGRMIRFLKDGMPCEDAMFNLECVRRGARFCMIDYPGYVYYRTGNTLLSTYAKTWMGGFAMNSKAWRDYCAAEHSDMAPYLGWAILNEKQLHRLEWRNIWRNGSPYGIWARYVWLREHARVLEVRWVAFEWFKTLVLTEVAKRLYVRPLRRYRLKKHFGSGVQDWNCA